MKKLHTNLELSAALQKSWDDRNPCENLVIELAKWDILGSDHRCMKVIEVEGVLCGLGFNHGSYYYLDSGIQCNEYGSFKNENMIFESSDPFVNRIANGE